MAIHPTAVVSPNAEIGKNVEIGPYAIIDDDVRIGDDCFIDAHVKIEGDAALAPTVERMVHAGIPVMGHIGLLPQHIKTSGVYRVTGRKEEEAERIIADAKAMEAAGVFAMVLECMPAELGKQITEAVGVPTIGIGAGVHCSGQVQVVNDLLGLFTDFQPKHARRYANLTDEIRRAFTEYASDVREQKFPGPENSF